MLRRYLESALKEFSFAHKKMAFISGPRQCGKTKIENMLLKDRGAGAYYNWDETEFRRLPNSPFLCLSTILLENQHVSRA
jgi:predicted AAA+ superfamily ATPase